MEVIVKNDFGRCTTAHDDLIRYSVFIIIRTLSVKSLCVRSSLTQRGADASDEVTKRRHSVKEEKSRPRLCEECILHDDDERISQALILTTQCLG